MTTPRPGSRAEQRRRTEARILDAASRLFVAAGYERTTIRAVAAAAEVDAGLVMHYFGSKQELFRRVIDAAPVPEISAAAEQATEQILATLADRLANETVASLTILRSMLTNSEAADVARVATDRYQAQIAQAIPADDAALRAAIISAITLGVTVSRHLVKIEELASADPQQIIDLLRPCILSLAGQPPQLRADHAVLGHDRCDQVGRSDVEGVVQRTGALRRGAHALEGRDFFIRPEFQGNVRPAGGRLVNRGLRGGNHERDARPVCRQGEGVGADLVGHVAVGRHPVGPDDDRVGVSLADQERAGAVGREVVLNAKLAQFPGGEPRSLQQRTGLVGDDV